MGRKKSILFGSIFVLALILLMPSIPAIQQKTIEDKAYSDFIEEIKTLDDDIKFPILISIIVDIIIFRIIRGLFLALCSIDSLPADYENIVHPLLWLRGLWLCLSSHYMIEILNFISDIFGLNWDIESPIPI